MSNFQGTVLVTNNAGEPTIRLDGENGVVGIGTTSPDGVLDIYSPGDSGSHIMATRHTLTLKGLNDPSKSEFGPRLPYIQWLQADGTRAMYLGWGNTSVTDPSRPKRVDMAFSNGYNLCIWQEGGGGNVGINTLNPQAQLDVVGNIHVSQDIIVGGNIRASGDVFLEGADCAEDFDVEDTESLEPGTVMVIGNNSKLSQCCAEYDKRVAGVLSGAGSYRPGIILGRQQSQHQRLPLALTGKVFCKVDAGYGSIEIGDLLTTSPTLGHAMKALEPLKAFGAVIGKALQPLREGQGLVPILVALQ